FVSILGGPPMGKLLYVSLFSLLLVSCHATARFYPVRGPLAEQNPTAVLVGKVTAARESGPMTVTGTQGEVFRGRWQMVKQPTKTTQAPAVAPTDNEMAALWDSIYGNGFFVGHILGSRQYGRASLQGNAGSVLKVEFCQTGEASNNSGV